MTGSPGRGRSLVRVRWCLWLLVAGCIDASAQPPADPDLFQAGLYGDDDRTITCVTGPAGAGFELVAWAWVPEDQGLAYITLRFDFPANFDHSRRPVFNDLISDMVLTDYSDGTYEWNLIFGGCPSGWVRLFVQSCRLLDDQPSRIGIRAAHSMARDCDFILNDLQVSNELVLNDPGCPTRVTASVAAVWGIIKTLHR